MRTNRRQAYQEAARIHHANMLSSLERRLQVARSRNDENLIQQLEAEMKYYN